MESDKDVTTESPTTDLFQGLISDEVLAWVLTIANPLNMAICCLGILGNMVNVAVFLTQDLSVPSNIGFLWLALADLGYLISTLTYFVMYPTYSETGYVELQIPYSLMYYFVHVDNYLVLVLTVEKCLCVVFPLRVKKIVTTKVMKIAVAAVYIVMLWFNIPILAAVDLNMAFFDPATNTTRIVSGFRSFIQVANDITVTGAAVSRPLCTMSIFILTLIMVFYLRKHSKARKNLTRGREQSAREKKAIRMVLALAIALLVLTFPDTIVLVCALIFPKASSYGGEWGKLVERLAVVFTLFEGLNLSINIIIYYTMSTKYRNSVHALFYRIAGKYGGNPRSPSGPANLMCPHDPNNKNYPNDATSENSPNGPTNTNSPNNATNENSPSVPTNEYFPKGPTNKNSHSSLTKHMSHSVPTNPRSPSGPTNENHPNGPTNENSPSISMNQWTDQAESSSNGPIEPISPV